MRSSVRRTIIGFLATAVAAVSVVAAAPSALLAAPPPPAVIGQEFTPVAPVRDLDTRPGGFIPGNGTARLNATQLHVGAGDTAVLNVTVADPTHFGYLTVHPEGEGLVNASTLNFAAHQTVSNLVMVPIGVNGFVDFDNIGAARISLVVDTVGVLHAGTGHDTYVATTPTRILDTRNGTGGYVAPITGHSTIAVRVAGTSAVPVGADAAVVNLTTVKPASSGYLQAYADGLAAPPITSVSNWAPQQTVANLAVVQLGADGKIDVANMGSGPANFIADVVGYYVKSGAHAQFVPRSQPIRVLDTRYSIGVPFEQKLGAGQTIVLHLAGANGVPTSGVAAAYLNLTATNASGIGFLTLYPHGVGRPIASSLNFAGGATVANATVIPVGADGSISIYNGGSQAVDVIADLYGFYL